MSNIVTVGLISVEIFEGKTTAIVAIGGPRSVAIDVGAATGKRFFDELTKIREALLAADAVLRDDQAPSSPVTKSEICLAADARRAGHRTAQGSSPSKSNPKEEISKMSRPCAMVKPHHPDCECDLCKSMRDEECLNPSVGTVIDSNVRVCAECARIMETEGFPVEYNVQGAVT